MNNPTPAYYERKAPAGKLDVYAVCKIYEVTDPAIFHAVKKLLRAGRGSGGKSKKQDVSEAIDSLRRYLEMEETEGLQTMQKSAGRSFEEVVSKINEGI